MLFVVAPNDTVLFPACLLQYVYMFTELISYHTYIPILKVKTGLFVLLQLYKKISNCI